MTPHDRGLPNRWMIRPETRRDSSDLGRVLGHPLPGVRLPTRPRPAPRHWVSGVWHAAPDQSTGCVALAITVERILAIQGV